jgi:membrane protein DedA with SNARE-associated domain
MFAVLLAFLIVGIIMMIIGGIIGFILGRSYGREETEQKYAPAKDWNKKEAVTYERKE